MDAAGRVTIGPQSPKLLAGTGKLDTHLIVVATADRIEPCVFGDPASAFTV